MTEVENEIDPRPSSILNAITGATGLVVNGDNALKEFDLVFDQMGEVGVALEEAGMSSNKVKAKLKELLKAQRFHRAHVDAMKALKDSYRSSLVPTDFTEELEAKAKALLDNVPNDPKSVMTDFDQKVGDARGRAPGASADGEDQDVMLTSQARFTVNARCPITSKPIEDIEQPVQDQKGYVYDKQSIEQYIRKKNGSCPCPQSGTSHVITLNDLRPARNVERMRKRQKLMMTQEQQR